MSQMYKIQISVWYILVNNEVKQVHRLMSKLMKLGKYASSHSQADKIGH